MLNYKVFTFSYFFLQSYEKTREKPKSILAFPYTSNFGEAKVP